jgi:hypothetical protein
MNLENHKLEIKKLETYKIEAEEKKPNEIKRLINSYLEMITASNRIFMKLGNT